MFSESVVVLKLKSHFQVQIPPIDRKKENFVIVFIGGGGVIMIFFLFIRQDYCLAKCGASKTKNLKNERK